MVGVHALTFSYCQGFHFLNIKFISIVFLIGIVLFFSLSFSAAKSEQFNIQFLTLEAVASLLRNTLDSWLEKVKIWGNELEEWFSLIWNMLRKECPGDLKTYEGIPLIPLCDNQGDGVIFIPLRKKSSIIQRRLNVNELQEDLKKVLREIGLTITDCPLLVFNHSAILRDEYIQDPTSKGILRALLTSDRDVIRENIQSLSPSDIKIFKACLANADQESIDFLRTLPIFNCLQGTGHTGETFVDAAHSIGYMDCRLEDIPTPLRLSKPLIDGRQESQDIKRLMQKLGVPYSSVYDIITNILNELVQGKIYTSDEKQKVLKWYLEHWPKISFNCSSCKGILSQMKFILTNGGTLLSPCELLDPEDPLLTKLFSCEAVFPNETFSTPPILHALRMLGMRTQKNITPDEVISCVDMIEEEDSSEKATALLHLLTNNQNLVGKYPTNGYCSVAEYMTKKKCIPSRRCPPEYYPQGFTWLAENEGCLSKPNETLIESKEFVSQSGAVVHFVDQQVGNQHSHILSKLGLRANRPTLHNVIAQLKECVKYADEDVQDQFEITGMMKDIYDFLNECRREDKTVKEMILHEVDICIWNGSTFTEPTRMCTGDLPFDLSPYMTSIPKSMTKYSNFFEALGVRARAETNDEALVAVLHEIREDCESKESVIFLREKRLLVLRILQQLQINGSIPDEVRDRLLVPAHDSECRLIPVDESAYLDRDWLSQDDFDDDEDFALIHPCVSKELAIFLQVPPVSRLLLDADDLEGVVQTGQHEPLTVRLWNILQDNYDDIDIFKEMIQNAEDAGAGEVRFLLDMRKNEQAMEKLFGDGMKACQGPALWVFNDAVFTDEDFENILRLGGRTKEKDSQKIGKFGTGFNSVYHITDVPCFVSRNYIQYFDPHSSYLGNILRDKSQPGVRVNLQKTKRLQKFSDQFMPFEGVFEFQLTQPFHYNGTLFRLPFRSKEAAQKSEICKESHDKHSMKRLMLHIWKTSNNLLMFTRSVRKVSIFYLSEEVAGPIEPEELFKVEKSSILEKDLGDGVRSSTESICRKTFETGNKFFHGESRATAEENLKIVKVTHENSETATNLAYSEEGREHGLCPKGSVVFPFYESSSQPSCTGEIFCFMPMSIKSALPVHINGSFAVTDDRRNLRPSLEFGKIQSRWNYVLLSDVISRAYISLLADERFVIEVMETYGLDSSTECLWPNIEEVSKTAECAPIFDAFYKAIVNGFDGNPQPAVFCKCGKMYPFDAIMLLGQDICKTSIQEEATTVLEHYVDPSKVVTEICEKTRRAFERVGLHDELQTKTYDEDRFYDEAFLPRITEIPTRLRNQLVLFALVNGTLKEKLRDIQCVPVCGEISKRPNELLHPQGAAAPMFSLSDQVFPHGESFNSRETLEALVSIGMIKDNISTETFVERCKTVVYLEAICPNTALERCHMVLEYLSNRLRKGEWEGNQNLQKELKYEKFLPVAYEVSVRDSFLPWKHVETSERYTSAGDIYPRSKRFLVSGVSLVLDESKEWKLPRNVQKFLDLEKRRPKLSEVLEQFTAFQIHLQQNKHKISNARVEETCNEIYKYLDKKCENQCPDNLVHALRNEQFFLVHGTFVYARQLAIGGKQLPPYLFVVSRFLKDFKGLLQSADVMDEFAASDYQSILQSAFEEGEGCALDSDRLEVVIKAADQYQQRRSPNDNLKVYLPDKNGIMTPVTELCYCDVDWVNDDENLMKVCHEKVNFSLAKKLGVKDVRQQMLQQYNLAFPSYPGEEFGQREKLSARIKRIIGSYSSHEAILKELLQNADDAGASELHFVYDTRKHGGGKLLGDNMKSLQGPALCVFNNRSFSSEDIRGIQDLGEGSKSESVEKIGRYGVGFNTVYHLTDCPSFISNGEKLCIFDPLLKHVPGATHHSPGRLVRVDERVRHTYSDVFPCYLEDQLTSSHDNYTVFRFPFRTAASHLSEKIWGERDIRELLLTFEDVAYESLIFLRNVTKISISEDKRGTARSEVSLKFRANLTMEGESEKDNFYGQVAEYMKTTKQGGDTQHLEPAEVVYTVNLKGTTRNEKVGSEPTGWL